MSVESSVVQEALGRIDWMRSLLAEMKEEFATPRLPLLAVMCENARDALGELGDMIEEELA